jgi:Protein of unknown function (DUF1585)
LKDNMPVFTRAFTEKLLTYALGRGVEPYDRITVNRLASETAAHGFQLQTLILGIVHSPPFQQRRGERQQTSQEIAKK